MDDFLTFLRINPYPHYVGFAFNEDMRKAIIEEAGMEWRDAPQHSQYGATTEFFRDGTHAAALCIVNFHQDDAPPPWTYAHEAVHVVDDVMERCGINWDSRNDEPYAYLMEWIVRMMVFARDAYDNMDSHKGQTITDVIRQRLRMAQNERAHNDGDEIPFKEFERISFKDAIKEGVAKAKGIEEGIEHGYLVKLPDELHYETRKLVLNVARDMADKLLAAQQKYGYQADWRKNTYTHGEWAQDVIHHLGKGDPLDIINYMAFARDRKWSTALVSEGFAAIHVQQDGDRLCLEVFNKADMLLDAQKHEAQFDEHTANRQYESLSCAAALNMSPEERNKFLNGEFIPEQAQGQVYEDPTNKYEPCCPSCQSPRVRHTAKQSRFTFVCKGCGAEFNNYELKER